jgi:CRISPR type III-A-associated protein Csm2
MLNITALTDENGNVLTNLVSDFGSDNVKELAELLSRKTNDKFKMPIEKNQLRKFYDSFLKIYNNKSSVDSKKIQLLMLKAQAEYSEKRLKISDFKKFFSNRIELVVKSDSVSFTNNLHALKLHFEALVGYFPK